LTILEEKSKSVNFPSKGRDILIISIFLFLRNLAFCCWYRRGWSSIEWIRLEGGIGFELFDYEKKNRDQNDFKVFH